MSGGAPNTQEFLSIHILDALLCLYLYTGAWEHLINILALSGDLYFLGVSACFHAVCAKQVCALSPAISSSRGWQFLSGPYL